VIRDELRLVEQTVCEGTRPAFEKAFLGERAKIMQIMTDALAAEVRTWQGNLARQAQRYETWMADRLSAELTPLSRDGSGLAADLLRQAEGRFQRVIEAFRDRLSRNIAEATGITVSSATWEVKRPQVPVIPVAVSRTFMTHWDLLWWLLPMWLVGGLFRRHVLGRIPWEVEKNLIRLVGDWARALDAAASELRTQAVAWVDTELATLDRLLGQRRTEASAFREALRRLEETGVPKPVSCDGRCRVQRGLPS
jgi:phage host-nuclease inhibitor protein Gam